MYIYICRALLTLFLLNLLFDILYIYIIYIYIYIYYMVVSATLGFMLYALIRPIYISSFTISFNQAIFCQLILIYQSIFI